MKEVLKTIPIEEINRDKRGVRIKSLRENRYNIIADIAYVPQSEIKE